MKSGITTSPLDTPVSVFTLEQFAQAMQVSPATVRRLHAAGRLPFVPLRLGRRLLFPVAAVQSFLSVSASQTTQN